MARDFDGTNQVAYSTTLPSTARVSWAWSLWVDLDSTAGEQVLFSNGNDADSVGYALEVESGNWKMLFNGIARVDTTVAAATGRTHLFFQKASGTGGTGTDGEVSVWVNGTKAGGTTNTAPNTPANVFSIGAQGNASTPTFQRFTNGRLAEIALWTIPAVEGEAFGAGRIAALADGVNPLHISPESMVAYWPLWGSASPEIELVGAVNLTLSNSPAAAAHMHGGRGRRRRPVSYTAGGGGGGLSIPIAMHHYKQMMGVN